MSRTSVLAERVSSGAWLRTLFACFFFATTLVPASASDPTIVSSSDVVSEWDSQANPQSLIAARAPSVAQAVPTPNAPDVLGCSVTVLPSDTSTSGNERAPIGNFLFGRSVYLITAA